MVRIFVINVGVNASHGRLRSPIFEDGTFEFIPIPERTKSKHYHNCENCSLLPRYENLPSFTGNDLSRYIPESFWNWRVHNDPEFNTFTYGDYPTLTPRASNLQKINLKDHLFFLARLTQWKDGSFTEEPGFYLIGFFEVENILKEVTRKPPDSELEKFSSNPHIRRGLTNRRFWDRFWVFKGSENSRRFRRAVPVTREFANQVITDSKRGELFWPKSRSDLQVIGSYTRACRIIESKTRTGFFWEWVSKFES